MGLLINRTSLEQDKSEGIISDLTELEGQIRQVLKMMEERHDCRDVVKALNNCRTVIDTSVAFVVGKNIETCLRLQVENGQSNERTVQEAIDLLVKSK
ncbi:MAG: metal-sensing transcriptional repressor [Bacillaceae bacterium]